VEDGRKLKYTKVVTSRLKAIHQLDEILLGREDEHMDTIHLS
jgi:hypothetical protein